MEFVMKNYNTHDSVQKIFYQSESQRVYIKIHEEKYWNILFKYIISIDIINNSYISSLYTLYFWYQHK